MSEDVAQVLHRASVPSMAVDPYAVLYAGKRRRLKRRVVTGAFVAALVAGSAAMGAQAGWWPTQRTPVASTSTDHYVDLTVAGAGGATQSFRVSVEQSDAASPTVRLVRPSAGGGWQTVLTVPAPGPGAALVQASPSGESVALIVTNHPASNKVALTFSDGTQTAPTLVPVPGSVYAVSVVNDVGPGQLHGPLTVTVVR